MLRDLTPGQLRLMRDVMREAARLQLEQADRVRAQLEGTAAAEPPPAA